MGATARGGAGALAGEDLRVLGIDHRVGFVDKTHDGVGAAGLHTVFAAVEIGAPQPRLVAQDFDAVAAETLGDPLAVESLRFMGAGVESRRYDRPGEVVAVHNTYCEPFDGAPYTLALAG